jgi:sugar phosphate isomerase/epimerase
MGAIGFSTGALARSDVVTALEWLRETNADAVELSALRLPELAPLVGLVEALDLANYQFISVHAPGRIAPSEERVVVGLLREFTGRGWPIVLHPDAISDISLWADFGPNLLLENMDKRKHMGRTVEELETLFRLLPEARLCFDIAHARQVDGTMTEAYRILKKFGARIAQIHISEVTSSSGHDRISPAASRAFQKVAALIPLDVPVILESRIAREEIGSEMERAKAALTPAAATILAA